jgi:glycine oxidase
VRTTKTHFEAPVVINCAGAWAAEIPPQPLPIRPVKGQMLAVVARRGLLRHVVRGPDVYLVPRSDGRVLIGSTEEDAGFDKRVDPDTVQRLHQAAAILVAELGEARMLEAWAGLRPTSADGLPVLGRGMFEGYFVACGHFRNGILLAPITARLLAQMVRGETPSLDISPFSPVRFG